jgi:uncharacterized protein YbcI
VERHLNDPVASIPTHTLGDDASATGSLLAEIANAIVRLYKEVLGRGPTKARAQFLGPDVLLVLLEDSLTVVERNLVALGEVARVREQRIFLEAGLEERKRSEVERILGRRTVGAISGVDPRRDIAVELFTLEPGSD